MNIQRRTFLGGLLAAVAASAAIGTGRVTVQSLEAAETKIKQAFPEPEEGYNLLIQPGYGLPVMNAAHSMTLELESPPTLMVQGMTWQPPGYRSMKANIEVRDEDAETMRLWFDKMLDELRGRKSIFETARDKDYNGIATFGPPGKDPLVKLEGLWPQSIDYDYTTDPKTQKLVIVARAEMSFDCVHQNVL